MTDAIVYTPRSGSIADRAITYLRLNGKANSAELADAVDCETASLIPSMTTAERYGAVVRGLVNGRIEWSLGDGTPATPAPLPAKPDDDPMVQITVPAASAPLPEIPQFLPAGVVRASRLPPSLGSRVTSPAAGQEFKPNTAPRGFAAVNLGASNDNESDSGRTRRLAGEGDVGAARFGGQPDERIRADGGTAHDAGFLRALAPGVARERDADQLSVDPQRGTADEQTSSPALTGARAAIWSTGEIAIETECGQVVLFSRDKAAELLAFFERIAP